MDKHCKEIKHMLYLYRAGRLSEEDMAQVNQHLVFCTDCTYLLVLDPAFSEQ